MLTSGSIRWNVLKRLDLHRMLRSLSMTGAQRPWRKKEAVAVCSLLIYLPYANCEGFFLPSRLRTALITSGAARAMDASEASVATWQ